MSKALNKWKEVINKKIKYSNAPFQENEIIYLRKAVGPCGIKDPELRHELRQHFRDLMPEDGYNITEEQKQRGIKYLRENTYKLNGSLRKNNIFTEFERHVIDNYVDFKLVGLYPCPNYFGGDTGYTLPIYRCIAKDGSSFDYLGTCYKMIKVIDVKPGHLKVVS